MKVLVIGKGGREHALVWKLSRSKRCERVYCAPGNAGTAEDGENVAIDPNDFPAVISFAKKENIGLIVIGPEDPLARGAADAFRKAGLRVFGPSGQAAQLEASKVFSKELMKHANVPTADFQTFDHPDLAKKFLTSRDYIALDGLTITPPYPPENLVVEGGKQYVIVHKVVSGPRRWLSLKRPEPRREPLNITTVKVPRGRRSRASSRRTVSRRARAYSSARTRRRRSRLSNAS
jgi:hypothetical protein